MEAIMCMHVSMLHIHNTCCCVYMCVEERGQMSKSGFFLHHSLLYGFFICHLIHIYIEM